MLNLSHKSQVNGHEYILTINMTTNLPINFYHGILVFAKINKAALISIARYLVFLVIAQYYSPFITFLFGQA